MLGSVYGFCDLAKRSSATPTERPMTPTGTTAVILHSVEPGRGKGCEAKGRSVVSSGGTSTVYQYDPQRGNTWATMPFAASTGDVFNRVPVYVRHPKK